MGKRVDVCLTLDFYARSSARMFDDFSVFRSRRRLTSCADH